MISLLLALAVLAAGFFIYGRITEAIFSPDGRETPAVTMADGVDYVPMKSWKAFLIQLLNIAGTGPIFGALMGGAVVWIWAFLGLVTAFGGLHFALNGKEKTENEQ